MKRKMIPIQVLSCFLVLMFMMVIGCSKSDNDAPAAYSQSDLVGTWHAHLLQAGSTDGWQYVTVTIDSTGTLSFSGCLDSDSNTSCPTETIVWTINSSGVISETVGGIAKDSHYTMTTYKNFIAGTGTSGGTSYQMLIAQKVVSGTIYTGTELNSQSFVMHTLQVGTDNMWTYANGTTNGTGAINLISATQPAGSSAPGSNVDTTISADTNGVVTMTGSGAPPYFHGFLSDDKKTVVGLSTNGSNDYALWILNITTGQSQTAGALPAQTGIGHLLACGASPAPLWAHETLTVASGGGITESNWVSNPSTVLSSTTMTASINSTGTITIAEDITQNGQMSSDGKFIVLTGTRGSGIYTLEVITQ